MNIDLKIGKIVGIAIATVIVLIQPSIAAPAREDVVKISVVPCVCFAPIYIAQQKGYLAEAGIKLDITQVAAGQDAIAFLAAGKIDALAGGVSAGLFNALNRGLNVRLVASMGGEDMATNQTPPVALVVRSDLYESGVTKPAQLKGKTIAIPGGVGAIGSFDLAVHLNAAGLTLKDVTVLNLSMPDTIGALKNKSVDAAVTTNPFLSQLLSAKTAVVAAPSSSSVLGHAIAKTGLLVNPEFLSERRDVAARLVKALIRASKDIQGNGFLDPLITKILSEVTGQNAETLSIGRYSFSPELDPKYVDLEAIQQVFLKEQILKKPAALDGVSVQVAR